MARRSRSRRRISNQSTAATSIEDLPEGILIHILSFLPSIDAIRTSSLSSKWRYLWHYVPILDFDILPLHARFDSSPLFEARQVFAGLLNKTLSLRPFTLLHTFRLSFNYHDYEPYKMGTDSWVHQALNLKVSELCLDFYVSNDCYVYETNIRYDLNFSDLKNSFVKVLKLHWCNIVFPVLTDGFSSLRSISLSEVFVTDDELSGLISSCPNLEFLFLSQLGLLQNFKIHSRKLKELKLVEPRDTCAEEGSFEICAPSLAKINFRCFSVSEYLAKDLSSLVEAQVYFFCETGEDFDCWCSIMQLLTSAKHLKRLSAYNVCLELDTWLELLEIEDLAEGSPFKNITHLELGYSFSEYYMIGIASFLELCPSLESLVVDSSNDGTSPEDSVRKPKVFNMPSLKQVEIKGYRGTAAELCFVELLKMHAVVLEKIIAVPYSVGWKVPPPFVLWAA